MRREDLCEEVRSRLARLPPPHANHYGIVPAPPPELSPSVMPVAQRHAAAMRSIGQLEALASELEDPWLISRILARREAVSSSAMEGTYSTLDELLAGEEVDDADNDASHAAKQVRDYALCLDRFVPEARSRGRTVFTRELVCDLHKAVMSNDDLYRGVPGELRKKVVWIGGQRDIAYSTYNPPPPDVVEACLADNIAYMRAEPRYDGAEASLLTRMAVAHCHFEAVHPHDDGNGRVGRLHLPLMMAADGVVPLYLSPYIEANREAYYEALKITQQRLEWHRIIGFVCDAVVGTVEELMQTRAGLTTLKSRWLGRRKFRSGSAAMRALEFIPHYPVMTVGRLANLLDVSFPQASAAAKQLGDVGILVERTGYRRNRVFSAPEALSIINRPFGSEPILPEN